MLPTADAQSYLDRRAVRPRVFQFVSALAEIDWRTGRVTVIHGDDLTSMTFAVCDWRGEIERPDIERIRALIAEHLNTCQRFSWPLLPTTTTRPTNIPTLIARDIVPGEARDLELDDDEGRPFRATRMRFGVIADAFDPAPAEDSCSSS